MLVVLSDTHGTTDHRLRGRTLAAVREADLVIHAGDFVTAAVLDALRAETADLRAVHGNADGPAVVDRLPPALTVEYGGVRFAVTHTRPGGPTALSLFGRERGADVVVSGHTHRPSFEEGPVGLLNPGSHADPRDGRPAHAELRQSGDGLAGRLTTPEGEVLTSFRL